MGDVETDFAITQIKLPFIGSIKGDYDLFQYLLHSWEKETLEILVPNWVASRFVAHEWDIIHLHLSLRINEEFYTMGKVLNSAWEESLQSKVYMLELLQEPCKNNKICLDLSSKAKIVFTDVKSKNRLLIKTIKDMKILKEGIKVYLKHLVPYFSRINASSSLDYALLKKIVFNEIKSRVQNNINYFDSLYEKLGSLNGEIIDYVNLEELRSFTVSEIDLDLLNLSMHEINHIPYMVAIKELEKQLYSSYNTIVLLYIYSL